MEAALRVLHHAIIAIVEQGAVLLGPKAPIQAEQGLDGGRIGRILLLEAGEPSLRDGLFNLPTLLSPLRPVLGILEGGCPLSQPLPQQGGRPPGADAGMSLTRQGQRFGLGGGYDVAWAPSTGRPQAMLGGTVHAHWAA